MNIKANEVRLIKEQLGISIVDEPATQIDGLEM